MPSVHPRRPAKFDGITRAGLDRMDERLALYSRDRGICQACGMPVAFTDFEVAHRIADTVANRKRWGDDVIDSPMNKAVTHRGRCNSAMNRGGRPNECEEIARKVREGGRDGD